MRLVVLNLTTHESLKGIYPLGLNPSCKANVWENIRARLCKGMKNKIIIKREERLLKGEKKNNSKKKNKIGNIMDNI